jgi:hypothetical protein
MIYCPPQIDSDQDDVLEVEVDQEDLEGMELDEPIPVVPRRGGGDRVNQAQVNSKRKKREFEKSQHVERQERKAFPRWGRGLNAQRRRKDAGVITPCSEKRRNTNRKGKPRWLQGRPQGRPKASRETETGAGTGN